MEVRNAKITITRAHAFTERLRSWKVLLDGAEIGRIRDNEETTFAASPGSHELQLKVDWLRSPLVRFEASTEEDVRFQCSTNFWSIVLLVGLLVSVPVLTEGILAMAIGIAVILVVFTLVTRDRYLNLQREESSSSRQVDRETPDHL